MVSQSFEIGSDDPRQLLACGTLFRRHNGVENWIVWHQVLNVDSGAVVKVDFDFLDLAFDELEPRADVDSFSGPRFRRHMLNHIP